MPLLRVVIDTNVLVSALLKNPSIPRSAVNKITSGRATLVYSDDIFAEHIDVLNRKKLKLQRVEIDNLLNYILVFGERISPFPQFVHFTDETDKKFYEVFKTAGADYLITGNIKHFPEDERIITPREFVEL